MPMDFCNNASRQAIEERLSTERDVDIRPLYRYLCPIMIFICFFGIIFNATLISISRQSKAVNKSPILLLSLNLAITDSIASLLNGLGILLNSLLYEVFGVKIGLCSLLVTEALRYVSLVASALHLLALAFVHYRGIVKPLHYRSKIFFSQHLSRTINMISIVCWIIPLTIMIGFLTHPCQGFHLSGCDYLFLLGFTFRYTVLVMFALPLLLMSIIYIKIFIKISRHQKGLRTIQAKLALRYGGTNSSSVVKPTGPATVAAGAPVNLTGLIDKTDNDYELCAYCEARSRFEDGADVDAGADSENQSFDYDEPDEVDEGAKLRRQTTMTTTTTESTTKPTKARLTDDGCSQRPLAGGAQARPSAALFEEAAPMSMLSEQEEDDKDDGEDEDGPKDVYGLRQTERVHGDTSTCSTSECIRQTDADSETTTNTTTTTVRFAETEAPKISLVKRSACARAEEVVASPASAAINRATDDCTLVASHLKGGGGNSRLGAAERMAMGPNKRPLSLSQEDRALKGPSLADGSMTANDGCDDGGGGGGKGPSSGRGEAAPAPGVWPCEALVRAGSPQESRKLVLRIRASSGLDRLAASTEASSRALEADADETAAVAIAHDARSSDGNSATEREVAGTESSSLGVAVAVARDVGQEADCTGEPPLVSRPAHTQSTGGLCALQSRAAPASVARAKVAATRSSPTGPPARGALKGQSSLSAGQTTDVGGGGGGGGGAKEVQLLLPDARGTLAKVSPAQELRSLRRQKSVASDTGEPLTGTTRASLASSECTCDNRFRHSPANAKLMRSSTIANEAEAATRARARGAGGGGGSSSSIGGTARQVATTLPAEISVKRPAKSGDSMSFITMSISRGASLSSSAVGLFSGRSNKQRQDNKQRRLGGAQTCPSAGSTVDGETARLVEPAADAPTAREAGPSVAVYPPPASNQASFVSSSYEPQRRHLHASVVNTQSNTKALVTTLLILGTYFISYVPAIIYQVLTCIDGCPYPLWTLPFSRRVLYGSMTTVLLIAKSIIDPLIYSYRMNEIQTAINRYLSKRRSRSSYAASMQTSQRFSSAHNHNNSAHHNHHHHHHNHNHHNHHNHHHSQQQQQHRNHNQHNLQRYYNSLAGSTTNGTDSMQQTEVHRGGRPDKKSITASAPSSSSAVMKSNSNPNSASQEFRDHL